MFESRVDDLSESFIDRMWAEESHHAAVSDAHFFQVFERR